MEIRLLHRPGYVSWCEDSVDSPTPVATCGADGVRNRDQVSVGPGLVPGLLLSPPDHEDRGGTFSWEAPRTFSTTKHLPDIKNSEPNIDPEGHRDDGNAKRPGSYWVVSGRQQKGRSSAFDPSRRYQMPSASPPVLEPSVDRPGATRVEDPRSVPRRRQVQRPTSVPTDLSRLLGGLSLDCSGPQRHSRDPRGLEPGCLDGGPPHAAGRQRCSRVPDFSTDILQTASDLEKENAHLVVVDLVLEVLEAAKWALGFSATDSRGQAHSGTWTPRGVPRPGDAHALPDEDTHVHVSPASTCAQNRWSGAGPRSRSVFEKTSGAKKETVNPDYPDSANYDSLSSAERLAQRLVLEFRENWCPSSRTSRGRLSLRSSLQELPGTGGVAAASSSHLKEEIRLRTRMRGSWNWAPPRLQVIFTVQPPHRRIDVVALQHFLCAGCGTPVESRYVKKLRYCEYLGRYFCDCCHGGSEAIIPARVLSRWDFSRFPVCDFSRQLLDSLWFQPLFDLSRVGKTLQDRVKELDRLAELQEQLRGVKKLLRTCRLSGRVLAEVEQLPAHLTEKPHLFSMDDLLKVKKGRLVLQFRTALHAALDHIESCQLCLARGFICEFCRENDVIFPFQSHICRQCPVCRSCFHKHCFRDQKCPRCRRMESRKNGHQE